MAVTTRSPARPPIRRVRRSAPRRSRRASPPPPLGLLLAAPLALLLVALAALQVVYAERVYPGVAALGVELGGATREEAEARLAQRTAALERTEVTLRLNDQAWRISAAELGLRLDPRPLAEAAFRVGREGSLPTRLGDLFSALSSGADVAWTPANPDSAALSAYVRSLAAQIDRPVEEAHLAVTPDLALDFRPGAPGRSLDVAQVEARLRGALLEGGSIDLAPLVRETPPKTTEAQLADAHAAAQRILAAPLTLTFGEQRWTVDRATIARMLSFEASDGQTWRIKLDDAPLREQLTQIASQIDQEPQNARLSWNGGKIGVLRESREGRKLDVDAAVQAALQALQSDDHTLALPVDVAKPAVDTRDIPNMGIRELIESGSTSFAGSIPEKQHNIKLAASRLNGVVVAPGATFSFNKEVGPTTLDAGFEWGYGLETSSSGVKTVPSVAGGICQVATTLFQPVFWSGYQIEERNWHLYWIPAYTSHGTVGLDATVDEASGLDFKFINNTPNYLLIQSWTDESTVNFALYGTKPDWTVDVDKPVITNQRKADPTPHYEERPDMPWGWKLHVSAARDGFDVEIVRRVTHNGEVRTLKLTSTYQPSSDVTMIGSKGKPAGVPLYNPPAPAPGTAPTPSPASTANPVATPAETKEVVAPTPTPPTAAPAQPTPPPPAATAPPPAPAAQPTATRANNPSPANAGQPVSTPTPSSKRKAKPTPTPGG